MKRFVANCAAVLVGVLLVGPVHAGSGQPSKGSGQAASQRFGNRARQHSGPHWRVFRPAPWQPRWQWLPEQPPDVLVDVPNPAGVDVIPGNDPNLGGDVLIPGGVDPNAAGPQPRRDVRGGNAVRPMAMPRTRAPQQGDKLNNRGSGVTNPKLPGR
jgi:hypothetical protein